MFPGSNLNSNAKLCFLLLIWIQFQSFLKLSFQLTFKASLPNSYSNPNWKLHFQIVILIQIQIWSLVSEFQCSNSSSMLCFQILIWIRIPNRVFEFIFESKYKAWFTNYYSYSNSDPKICFRILIGILFLTRIRKPNFEFKFE